MTRFASGTSRLHDWSLFRGGLPYLDRGASRGRVGSLLSRPLSNPECILGWLVASATFGVVIAVAGGIASGDSSQSVYAAWALAHGHMGCGYPASGVPGYAPTAPGYVLVSGAFVALLRIGHEVAFPTLSAGGAPCAAAVQAMNQWSLHTLSLEPTLRIGFVGWIVLMAGVIAFLRASGRGRCIWEPATLLIVACVPPAAMCLAEFFHPQDLVAMGLALAALGCVRRGAWMASGLLLGVAIMSQQFTLLVAVPLLVLAPRPQRLKFVTSIVASVGLIAIPVLALTAGRGITSILIGPGGIAGESLATLTGAHGSLLFVLSRIVPLCLAAMLAARAGRRLGSNALDAIPLTSVVALSLSLRLAFEISVWGYYFMAIAVMLVVLGVIRGRIGVPLVIWLATLSSIAFGGGLSETAAFGLIPICICQLILVAGAIGLAGNPLLVTVVESSTNQITTASDSPGLRDARVA